MHYQNTRLFLKYTENNKHIYPLRGKINEFSIVIYFLDIKWMSNLM
jgi:predicted RNA-binding protein